jgi:hypothetical protein
MLATKEQRLLSLYYVNKDALFSFHKASETFLQVGIP